MEKVAKQVDEITLFAFAMTCKAMREIQEEVRPVGGRKRKKITLSWAQLQDHPLTGDRIKWAYGILKKNGQPRKDMAILVNLACMHRHLDALKWLKGKGLKMNEYVCENAAFRGHLRVLKWLR